MAKAKVKFSGAISPRPVRIGRAGGFKLHWAAIALSGESSKRGEKIPAATLFQSSSLYERALPKAGPEHTVSTEKREKRKRDSLTNRHSTTVAPHGHFGRGHTAPHSDNGEDESHVRLDQKTQSRQKDLMRERRQRWVKAEGLDERLSKQELKLGTTDRDHAERVWQVLQLSFKEGTHFNCSMDVLSYV